LSRGKAEKIGDRGDGEIAEEKSKHPPLQNKGGAPAEEDRENSLRRRAKSKEDCNKVRKVGAG
jgi:hypothetical protein